MRINIHENKHSNICPLRVEEAAWRRLTGTHLLAQAGDALGRGLHKGGKSQSQFLDTVLCSLSVHNRLWHNCQARGAAPHTRVVQRSGPHGEPGRRCRWSSGRS